MAANAWTDTVLAAGPHLLYPREAFRLLGDYQVEQGGGEEDRGDLVIADQLVERGDGQLPWRRDHDGAAGQQRHPDLVGGRVEGVGRVHEHAGVPAAAPAVVSGKRGHGRLG